MLKRIYRFFRYRKSAYTANIISGYNVVIGHIYVQGRFNGAHEAIVILRERSGEHTIIDIRRLY